MAEQGQKAGSRRSNAGGTARRSGSAAGKNTSGRTTKARTSGTTPAAGSRRANSGTARRSAGTGRAYSSGYSTAGKYYEEDSVRRRDLLIVILFALMVFLFLTGFGLLGTVGAFVSKITFGLFGWPAYILPVFVFAAVLYYTANQDDETAVLALTGAVILLLVLGVFCELITGDLKNTPLYNAGNIYRRCGADKNGGGVIAGSVAFLLYHYLKMFGAVFVQIVLIVISFVLISRRSIVDLTQDIIAAARRSRIGHLEEKARIRAQRQQYYNDYPDDEFPDEYAEETGDDLYAPEDYKDAEYWDGRQTKRYNREEQRLRQEEQRRRQEELARLHEEERENARILRDMRNSSRGYHSQPQEVTYRGIVGNTLLTDDFEDAGGFPDWRKDAVAMHAAAPADGGLSARPVNEEVPAKENRKAQTPPKAAAASQSSSDSWQEYLENRRAYRKIEDDNRRRTEEAIAAGDEEAIPQQHRFGAGEYVYDGSYEDAPAEPVIHRQSNDLHEIRPEDFRTFRPYYQNVPDADAAREEVQETPVPDYEETEPAGYPTGSEGISSPEELTAGPVPETVHGQGYDDWKTAPADWEPSPAVTKPSPEKRQEPAPEYSYYEMYPEEYPEEDSLEWADPLPEETDEGYVSAGTGQEPAFGGEYTQAEPETVPDEYVEAEPEEVPVPYDVRRRDAFAAPSAAEQKPAAAAVRPAQMPLPNKEPVTPALQEITVHTEREEGPSDISAVQVTAEDITEPEKQEPVQEERRIYQYPPLNLLRPGMRANDADTDAELRDTAMRLQETLKTFGVNVKITDISQGPAVTRYELLPEQGVKVSKIVGLQDDIMLALAATDIRIEAPIPGKSAIGIEVPNKTTQIVGLYDILATKDFEEAKSRLSFGVGKDIAGKAVVTDIARMPHVLIAGATGSGKSVCINTIIVSILYKASPEEVKFIMIDPKVVELSVYNGIPHLMIPVVTDSQKAAAALNWAVAEMDSRYRKFAEASVRDIKGYNAKARQKIDAGEETDMKIMPQILVIVDELADLMMVAKNDVETAICRLAQLARAAGIHLVIATQRPSVDVITGLIKANMPSRIAFAVSQGVDSRTIIDMYGAEKLLGKGDMLFFPQGLPKPARIQGAFVSDDEVTDVVEYVKEHNQPAEGARELEKQIMESMEGGGQENDSVQETGNSGPAIDSLFHDAGQFIIKKNSASIGLLQRGFRIGFNRAARIMDQLSEAGVVSEAEGTKPRRILMNELEFEQYCDDNI